MARRFLLLFAVTLCACDAPKTVEAPKEALAPARRKFKDANVIFVSFDALGASKVHELGHFRETTNNIDSIARSGLTFENCYSVSSWTVPSSMSWFTGVYPSVHQLTNKYAVYNDERQVFANVHSQAPQLITLAEALKNRGYATVAFTGNAGVSRKFGFNKGFDCYVHDSQVFGRMTKSVPRAIQWLRQNKDKKFFLFLHGYDNHGQSTPKNGYDYRFVKESYDGRFSGSEQEQELLREEGLDLGKVELRTEDVEFWRAIYDEKVQRCDAKFGELLVELDKLGLRDNTLLVLTSDHGTELYEHQRFDHGFTLYNELIHVPLIIQWPGQKRAKRIAGRVSSLDILPTLLDLLDVPHSAPISSQCQGQSLMPMVAAGSTRGFERALFSETNYRDYTFKRSIIDEDGWKLILTLESGEAELYHLPSDPWERVNLRRKHPERVAQLRERVYKKFLSLGSDIKARSWRQGLNPVYPMQGRKK